MTLDAPVLIIDDDPAMTETVKEILEAAGHATAVASNPFYGLRLAREVKPSVVMCDMVMPGMAGSDVFRALAADPATASIPRVMMTGYMDADRTCSDGFLLKPFYPHEMLALLERLSSAARAPRPSRRLMEADWRG